MSFWTRSGLKFQDIIDLPENNLILLLNSMSRSDIIEWLSWNDKNGIYEDERSMKELGNVMSREEGIEILIRQILQNDYR